LLINKKMKMKILNNLSILFAVVMAITLVGCVGSDFEGTDYPGNEFEVGGSAISLINYNADDKFDIDMPEISSHTFRVNVEGNPINEVVVTLTAPNGAQGVLKTVTSFPDTSTISLVDALAVTGTELPEAGSTFNVALSSPDATTFENFDIAVVSSAIPFKSELDGLSAGTATVTAQGGAAAAWDGNVGTVWSGPVTLVRQQENPDDDGEYTVQTQNGPDAPIFEDISFGAYYAGYGTDAQGNLPNGDLRFRDVDGKLSITGFSQWDESFSVTNVVVDGTTLSFAWTNDYGEGAEIVLVREDGEDWPPLN